MSAMDYWYAYDTSNRSLYEMKQLANQQSNDAKALANLNNNFNASEAAKQRSFEQALFNAGNQFNAAEAAKNRNWQEAMSNSAHQREIKDLQAAGLNPILSASGGNGAAVTAGATASSLGAPSGAHATADTSVNAAIAQIYGSLMSYMSNTDAMKTSAKSAERIAEVQSATSRYVADQSAEASRYASSASMYNAALNAATNKAINASQLAQQQKLAEYDFEKQMQYRQYDRDTQYENLNHQLYNELYLRENAPQTTAGVGLKALSNVQQLVNTIKSAVTGRKAKNYSGKF